MVQQITARIRGLFAWWMRDIRGRKSLIGKVASLAIGVVVLCCACSFGLATVRSTGQAVGIIATNTPLPAPTNTPPPTNTPAATATPQPSATPAPTNTAMPSPTPAPPTATAEPTVAPTDTPTVEPSATPKPTTKPEPTAKPAAPPAKTALTAAPGTVTAGAYATVAIHTAPGTTCDITVLYKSGASTAQGLYEQQADGDGNISWTWKVGTRTTPGTWPVIITCAGQTLRTSVTVT